MVVKHSFGFLAILSTVPEYKLNYTSANFFGTNVRSTFCLRREA